MLQQKKLLSHLSVGPGNSSCGDHLWAQKIKVCCGDKYVTGKRRQYFPSLPTGTTYHRGNRKKGLQKGVYKNHKTCKEEFVLLQAWEPKEVLDNKNDGPKRRAGQ